MTNRKRNLHELLTDIATWGERLETYLEEVDDEAAFLENELVQDAVVRCLEVIGEASGRIVAGYGKQAFADIEFVEAYWTRNRLAHGYYNLDMRRVWVTATVSAPKLVQDVRAALKSLG